MSKTKIFHNPRCSKSRQALALLEENNESIEIIQYLNTPPSIQELSEILDMLGMQPRDLMRQGEKEYKDLNLNDATLSKEALVANMVEHPRLIERPIVLKNGKAVVGRPPENVLTIL